MYPIVMKRRKGYHNTKKCYPTTVNSTVEELLQKGQYRAETDINSINFPAITDGSYQISARIINIKRRPVFEDMAFEITMDNIYERGYEFADLRETLSVLDQHKNIPLPPVIYVLATKIDKSSSLLAPCIAQQVFLGKKVYLESV